MLIATSFPISGLFWGRRLQPLLPSSSDQFGKDNLISLDPSRASSCDEKWVFNVERKIASRKKLCQQKVENQRTIGGKIRSRLLSNGKHGSWIHILNCFMNISFYQSWEKTFQRKQKMDRKFEKGKIMISCLQLIVCCLCECELLP